MMIILSIVLIVLVLGVLYYLFPLIKVVGNSMYPTYFDGEVILATRLFKKSNLKKGDVVVYHCPTDSKVVIKRIREVCYRGRHPSFYCLGDNLAHSYDSRHYGFVSENNIICKVVKHRANEMDNLY